MIQSAVLWGVLSGVLGFTFIAYLSGPRDILGWLQAAVQNSRFIPRPVKFAFNCEKCVSGWFALVSFPLLELFYFGHSGIILTLILCSLLSSFLAIFTAGSLVKVFRSL